MRKSIVTSLVAAATVLTLGVPAAYALNYSTSGTSELFSLGDQMGSSSDYDQLIVSGVTGALNVGTIALNQLDFIAGVNAFVPATYSYSFSETMTVSSGGGTQTLTIPFNISIDYSDTLSILGGSTASFLVNGNLWHIVVNALTIGPNAGGSMIAYLTATVTDPPAVTPLPGAMALFAGGLGALGLFGWRKRRRAVSFLA
jgi:hypothetical protein